MPFKDKEYSRKYHRLWWRKHHNYPKPRKLTGEYFKCQICSREFYRTLSNIERGIIRFCSSKCWGKQLSRDFKEGRMMISERFHNTGKTWFKKGYDITKHWNWQGGITPIQAKIRNSIGYANWRKAIFKRDDYICLNCGKRGGQIIAHHIYDFSKYPDLRLKIDNGITLCRICH